MATKSGRSRAVSRAAASLSDAVATGWRLRALGMLVLAVGLSAGAVEVWSHLHTYLRGCDRFRLAAIEVQGRRLLDSADVLEASGLKLGESIYAVDMDLVAARLDSMVWIRRSHVVRKPPDRLVVSVVERQRLAWIELGEEVLGIDADGTLLPGDPHPQEERADLDLPVIRGVMRSLDMPEGDTVHQLQPGDAVPDSAVGEILRWWQGARASQPEICSSISEVEPLEGGGLRLFLVGDGLEIRLPIADRDRRLTVLGRLLERIYRECPDPAYVDLRYDGQAVVGRRRAPGQSIHSGGKAPSHG